MDASINGNQYVPGVCNINRSEIAYRRKAGYAGLAACIILGALLMGFNLNRWLRLVLFFPAFVAAIGFLQAKNKFCVSYAASGQQNAVDGSATASKVEGDAARRKDRLRARSLNLQAAALSAVATILIFSIPVR